MLKKCLDILMNPFYEPDECAGVQKIKETVA